MINSNYPKGYTHNMKKTGMYLFMIFCCLIITSYAFALYPNKIDDSLKLSSLIVEEQENQYDEESSDEWPEGYSGEWSEGYDEYDNPIGDQPEPEYDHE